MTEKEKFGFGNDPIVIRKHVSGKMGGTVLDVSGFTEDYIRAGHVIIRDTATQKVFKPMPVSNDAYASLPEGYHYFGICEATVDKKEPIVAVLTIGEVNDKALPYDMSSIMSAFKAAVPTIVFDHD